MYTILLNYWKTYNIHRGNNDVNTRGEKSKQTSLAKESVALQSFILKLYTCTQTIWLTAFSVSSSSLAASILANSTTISWKKRMALSHKDMYTITVNISLAVVGSARPHPPSVGVPGSARRCIYLRKELTLVVQLDVQLSSQFINLHKIEMGWGDK